VFDVGPLRAFGVDRQLDVHALLRVRRDAGDIEGVRLGRVQAGFAAAPGVVVLTDEHGIGQQNLRVRVAQRWGPRLERHVGVEVPFVVAVEVDLEGAADMWLIVRMVIERHVVDLDRPVVARWVTRRGRGVPRDEGDPDPRLNNSAAPPGARNFLDISIPSSTLLVSKIGPGDPSCYPRGVKRRNWQSMSARRHRRHAGY
jgi:hypothetical protein